MRSQSTAAPQPTAEQLAARQLARAAKQLGIDLPVVEPAPDAVSAPVSPRAAQKARMHGFAR